MNTKNIEKALKENALALEGGDEQQKQFSKDLVATIAKIEAHRKVTYEKPLDENSTVETGQTGYVPRWKHTPRGRQ